MPLYINFDLYLNNLTSIFYFGGIFIPLKLLKAIIAVNFDALFCCLNKFKKYDYPKMLINYCYYIFSNYNHKKLIVYWLFFYSRI